MHTVTRPAMTATRLEKSVADAFPGVVGGGGVGGSVGPKLSSFTDTVQ